MHFRSSLGVRYSLFTLNLVNRSYLQSKSAPLGHVLSLLGLAVVYLFAIIWFYQNGELVRRVWMAMNGQLLYCASRQKTNEKGRFFKCGESAGWSATLY